MEAPKTGPGWPKELDQVVTKVSHSCEWNVRFHDHQVLGQARAATAFALAYETLQGSQDRRSRPIETPRRAVGPAAAQPASARLGREDAPEKCPRAKKQPIQPIQPMEHLRIPARLCETPRIWIQSNPQDRERAQLRGLANGVSSGVRRQSEAATALWLGPRLTLPDVPGGRKRRRRFALPAHSRVRLCQPPCGLRTVRRRKRLLSGRTDGTFVPKC